MAYPTHFLDRNQKLWRIVDRLPYVMTGQWNALAPGDVGIAPVDNNSYIHNIQAPFEIHDLIPRAVQLVGAAGTGAVADPPPHVNAFWRLSCRAVQKGDFTLFRAATVVDSLVGRDTNRWSISGPLGDSPVYLETSQGFLFTTDSIIPAGGLNLRVNVTLRGYVISLEEEIEPRASTGPVRVSGNQVQNRSLRYIGPGMPGTAAG